jgi:hypothetical protein
MNALLIAAMTIFPECYVLNPNTFTYNAKARTYQSPRYTLKARCSRNTPRRFAAVGVLCETEYLYGGDEKGKLFTCRLIDIERRRK